MKIAILGGGLAGLSSAYYLAKKGHVVVLYEAGNKLGGLAQGFDRKGWNWELERTYHHIFSNDNEILDLAREIGYNKFVFTRPLTASLFGEINNYRIFPVDSPKDFLLLPELSLTTKLRSAVVLAFLKITPFLPFFEKYTASSFLRKTMGEEMWKTMWEQLFRKKFGIYAEKVLASFIWARISKRTQKLGYPTGGFQTFINALAQKNEQLGVVIKKGASIIKVDKSESLYNIRYKVEGKEFVDTAEIVISTLPYPLSIKVMEDVLGRGYCEEQKKRKYLYAINLVLKTNEPILNKVYWLNIGAKDIPFMCLVQHTNFIENAHYDNNHICYIAWYVDENSELLKKTDRELLDYVLPHLKNISHNLNQTPEIIGLFKAPYAQPIFDEEFAKISRSFRTPDENVYIANMDMTYPYDRGTNYAVDVGKKVAHLLDPVK